MRPCCCKEVECNIASGWSVVITHAPSLYYPYGAITTSDEISKKYDIPESNSGLEIFWETDKGVPESIKVIFDKGDKYAYGSSLLWTWGRLPVALLERDVLDASSTSPIDIITKEPHGFKTGDIIEISGVVGLAGANDGNIEFTLPNGSGSHKGWKITVVDSSTFSLDGSSGRGYFDIVESQAKAKLYNITAPTIKDTFFSYLIGSEIGYFNTAADWDPVKDTIKSNTLRMFGQGYDIKYPAGDAPSNA